TNDIATLSIILLRSTRLCDRDRYLRDLHSFPTRRSSDLGKATGNTSITIDEGKLSSDSKCINDILAANPSDLAGKFESEVTHDRSEEHTSELQSRENLVCRLLLEKKKK